MCSPLLFESEADFYSFINHAHVAVADAAKVVHDALLVDGRDLLQQHQRWTTHKRKSFQKIVGW